MYRIEQRPADHRLDVTFDGYSDVDQATFVRELRAAAFRVRRGGDAFDLLCDFSQAPVMPQDVTLMGRAEIEWCVANGLRRSANVMGSVLAKMQLERIAPDHRFRAFLTRADALAWLASAD